jgi:hypothetical protein
MAAAGNMSLCCGEEKMLMLIRLTVERECRLLGRG